MEKKEAQDLTKAISNLVIAVKEQNKSLDKISQILRDNTEAIKELKTRLGSVANLVSNGGTIVNP